MIEFLDWKGDFFPILQKNKSESVGYSVMSNA